MKEDDKKESTETPDDLFSKASEDVQVIEGIILNKIYFNEGSKSSGAYHSQQATEKLLKGYLAYNNIKFDWGHNLKTYYNYSLNIDNNFEKIKREISHLNNYKAAIKYTREISVNDKTFAKVLKDLKTVYNFSPFQKIYDEFVEKGLCNKIDKKRFDIMILNYNNILKEEIIEKLECISYNNYEKRYSLKVLEPPQTIRGLMPDGAIDGFGRKLICEDKNGKICFFLERGYKFLKNENYKFDLWEINKDFSEMSALNFVNQLNKEQNEIVKGKEIDLNKKDIDTGN